MLLRRPLELHRLPRQQQCHCLNLPPWGCYEGPTASHAHAPCGTGHHTALGGAPEPSWQPSVRQHRLGPPVTHVTSVSMRPHPRDEQVRTHSYLQATCCNDWLSVNCGDNSIRSSSNTINRSRALHPCLRHEERVSSSMLGHTPQRDCPPCPHAAGAPPAGARGRGSPPTAPYTVFHTRPHPTHRTPSTLSAHGAGPCHTSSNTHLDGSQSLDERITASSLGLLHRRAILGLVTPTRSTSGTSPAATTGLLVVVTEMSERGRGTCTTAAPTFLGCLGTM